MPLSDQWFVFDTTAASAPCEITRGEWMKAAEISEETTLTGR
jgi:hypothetical protein